nr:MAG TPA: hypothetical protein [Microviridae sp.]
MTPSEARLAPETFEGLPCDLGLVLEIITQQLDKN